MSEKRKKTASILLRLQGKSVSVELFPSGEWPEENGADGLFRVRIDDAWHQSLGKYTFLSYSAIGELVAALLAGGAPVDEPMPYLPEKADVSVYSEHELDERGIVKLAPYQKRDGRWYVQVWRFGKGTSEFLCSDITLRRVRG